MAHASGAQWYSYSKMGQNRGSIHASIHNQPSRNKGQSIPAKWRLSGPRILLVVAFFLFSLMFGVFIQTSFGSEEGSRTEMDTQSSVQMKAAVYANGIDNVHEAHERHVVVAGDTLWALAQDHAPEGMDIRQYVHEMKTLNAMEQSVIYEGQVILLP